VIATDVRIFLSSSTRAIFDMECVPCTALNYVFFFFFFFFFLWAVCILIHIFHHAAHDGLV